MRHLPLFRLRSWNNALCLPLFLRVLTITTGLINVIIAFFCYILGLDPGSVTLIMEIIQCGEYLSNNCIVWYACKSGKVSGAGDWWFRPTVSTGWILLVPAFDAYFGAALLIFRSTACIHLYCMHLDTCNVMLTRAGRSKLTPMLIEPSVRANVMYACACIKVYLYIYVCAYAYVYKSTCIVVCV